MPESFPIAPNHNRHRLAVLGGSLCLAAILANACSSPPTLPDRSITVIDCSDPKNTGIRQPEDHSADKALADQRAEVASNTHNNGTVHSSLFGDMSLHGLRLELSDAAIKKAVQDHPDSVEQIFYQPYEEEGFRYQLMTLSPKGITYEKSDSNQAVMRVNKGWSIAWQPEYRGFTVDMYSGDRNQKLASTCKSYEIGQTSKPEHTEQIDVRPTMEKPCSDPKIEIASYTAISDKQLDVLCQSGAAISPFDRHGVLKAIIMRCKPSEARIDKNSGFYVSYSKTIALPVPFTNYPNPLAEQSRPIHEWTHHIYQLATTANKNEIRGLEAAYNAMATNKKAPSEKAFALVNEETYFSKYMKSNDTQGHPYSNKNELFASTTTVLRTWPQEFMHEYDQASAADQQHIKQAVQAVYDLLVARGGNDAEVAKLIPRIKDIEKHLALAPS